MKLFCFGTILMLAVHTVSLFAQAPKVERQQVRVWSAETEGLKVSKYAFDEYEKNGMKSRTVLLFRLKEDIGTTSIAGSLEDISKRMKPDSRLGYLLRRTDSYVLCSEAEQRWYILQVETGKNPSFQLSSAEIVFGNILAYSSVPIQGSDASILEAIARLTESAKNRDSGAEKR